MRENFLIKTLPVLFWIMVLASCREKDEADPILTISLEKVSFAGEGGDTTITITSNEQWSISNSASSWLQLSQMARRSI